MRGETGSKSERSLGMDLDRSKLVANTHTHTHKYSVEVLELALPGRIYALGKGGFEVFTTVMYFLRRSATCNVTGVLTHTYTHTHGPKSQ